MFARAAAGLSISSPACCGDKHAAHGKGFSHELIKERDFIRSVREGLLRDSQFADILVHAHGQLSRRSTW